MPKSKPSEPKRKRFRLFSRLIRRKPVQDPKYTERARQARKQRQQMRQKLWRQKLRTYLIQHSQRLLISVIVLVTVGLIALFVFFVHSSGAYTITEINFYGNQRISGEHLRQLYADYLGGSMLAISNRQLEQVVLDEYSFVRYVDARKYLPGRVDIYIEERVPRFSWINLSGIYLLDSEGVVVGLVADYESQGLTNEQSQVVSGYGDVNLSAVQELYLSRFENAEERDLVVWADVPWEDKWQSLMDLRQNLTIRLQEQLLQGIPTLDESDFSDLPRVFSFENIDYELGDVTEEIYALFSQRIIDFLAQETELEMTRLLWQSDYSILVNTTEKEFTFSSADSIDYQLKKLEAIIDEGILGQAISFDLRGEKIVAR